jgi:competence protein ComEC
LYGIIVGVWCVPRWQTEWKLPTVVALLLVIGPLAIWKTTELQITALASQDRQILVIQDRGKTMLINSGNESVARFIVLPFLQQQAINQIDRAIDSSLDLATLNSWQTLSRTIPVQNFHSISASGNSGVIKFEPLPLGKIQKFDRLEIKPIKDNPAIFQINIPEVNEKWLVIGNNNGDLTQSAIDPDRLIPAATLLWDGSRLTEQAIAKINPQVAIATTANPDLETIKSLEKKQVRVYYTGRDGAIQWTPTEKFKPYLEGER